MYVYYQYLYLPRFKIVSNIKDSKVTVNKVKIE